MASASDSLLIEDAAGAQQSFAVDDPTCGAAFAGLFDIPTVIPGVAPEAAMRREESFGPAAGSDSRDLGRIRCVSEAFEYGILGQHRFHLDRGCPLRRR
jgi:hypothetical protein